MAALKGGAAGYLLKDMEPEEILRGIRRALQGDMVLSSRLAPVLARAVRPGPHRAPGRRALHDRPRAPDRAAGGAGQEQ